MTEKSMSTGPVYVGPEEVDACVGISDRSTWPARRSIAGRAALASMSTAIGAYVAFMAAGQLSQSGMLLTMCALAFAGGILSTWSPCGYSSLSLLRPSGPYSAASVLRWLPTLVMHAAGYLLGAVLLGGALGLVAWAIAAPGFSGWPLVLVGAVTVGYALHQFKFLQMPYPQRRAQVPHDARLCFTQWKVGLLYGLILGLNFTTYVRTPLLYVVVLAAVLSGSMTYAVALVLALNLGRFVPLVINALPVHDWAVQQWLASNEENAVTADAMILSCGGASLVILGLM